MQAIRHTPVLAERAVELLGARRRGLFVDGTIGTGGHAELILGVDGGAAELLGVDRDPGAIAEARERLASFGPRVQLVCANFSGIAA
ncbi:MAG TPA: 16S rRNA (cytosine(1402)-N(4))-methyltransferase, partial [Candidatus Krumholzibacteriaceae bacterium]